MHTRRKISFLFLLAAIAVFSCKKKTNEPVATFTPIPSANSVDSIIGIYVGTTKHHEEYSRSNSKFDTIYADTFHIMKGSDSLFCYYHTTPYGKSNVVCFLAKDTNVYVDDSRIGYDTIKFFPEKDSMKYSYESIMNSGFSGHIEIRTTFIGKR